MLSLLQPSIRRLSPATIAVCISAATKVFGNWAAGLSENWDAQSYADAKSLVEKAIETFTLYASSSELEIQERVSEQVIPC
jgi:AP-3 complex subunit delta-1